MNNRFGTIKVDITPTCNVELEGYSRKSISIGVRDKLYAVIWIFKQDTELSCLVSIDNIGMTVAQTNEIRHAISEELEMDKNKVVVFYTHTHSAPKAINREGEWLEYFYFLKNRIISMLRYSEVGFSDYKQGFLSEIVSIGMNRRLKSELGKAIMGNNYEGYVDNRLLIVKIIDPKSEKTLGILIRITAHGNVLMKDNLMVSADYIGEIRKLLENKYNCSVFIVNGAAGNINALHRGDNQDIETMGKILLKAASRGIENITVYKNKPVVIRSNFQKLYTKKIPNESEMIKISNTVKDYWGVDTDDWIKQVKNKRAENIKRQEINVEISVVNLGDIFLIGIPMEPFSDTAYKISNLNLNELLFLNGYTNGYLGYMSSEEEYDYGGYEVEWNPIVYGTIYGYIMPLERSAESLIIRCIKKILIAEGVVDGRLTP